MNCKQNICSGYDEVTQLVPLVTLTICSRFQVQELNEGSDGVWHQKAAGEAQLSERLVETDLVPPISLPSPGLGHGTLAFTFVQAYKPWPLLATKDAKI